MLFVAYFCRGVNYASKSPSRQLKKECATILESMKVDGRSLINVVLFTASSLTKVLHDLYIIVGGRGLAIVQAKDKYYA